jgi:GTPase
MSSEFKCGVVAILGRPNVGKSTLLNALVGEQLAPVSPKAQTTRRKLRGIVQREDAQIILVDTPGLHRAPVGKKLNEICVAEALGALDGVDAILYLIDGSRPFTPEKEDGDEAYLLSVLEGIKGKIPVFVLINKKDVWMDQSRVFTTQERLAAALERIEPKAVFSISAKNHQGLDFLEEVLKIIPVGPALFPKDDLTDQSLRMVAGELIQETLFTSLGDELPYSCAVEVESFKEPEEGRRSPEIHALIHVERDSQKPMVIGSKGAKIREIGERSRLKIERLLGTKTVLKLKVKVSEKWSRDPERLKQLGYILPEAR